MQEQKEKKIENGTKYKDAKDKKNPKCLQTHLLDIKKKPKWEPSIYL